MKNTKFTEDDTKRVSEFLLISFRETDDALQEEEIDPALFEGIDLSTVQEARDFYNKIMENINIEEEGFEPLDIALLKWISMEKVPEEFKYIYLTAGPGSNGHSFLIKTLALILREKQVA